MPQSSINSMSSALLIGVAGTGMSGLAILLNDRGTRVGGVDDALDLGHPPSKLDGISLMSVDQAISQLTDETVVIYSDAVPPSHPIRQAATTNNLPALPFNEALALFAKTHKLATIAVAGTHGKTTTTAYLAKLLLDAGHDPSVLIGTGVMEWGGKNARSGSDSIFIVEADEYYNHFHALRPTASIITNIEYDHPDYFPTPKAYVNTFIQFVGQHDRSAAIIAWQDTIKILIEKSASAKFVAPEDSCPPRFRHLPGTHLQKNACLAHTMMQQLGLVPPNTQPLLNSPLTLERRLEPLGRIQDTPIISDYGHHPTEISATLSGFKSQHPDQRILAVIEPHMSARVATFIEGYVALANEVDCIISPIFEPLGRSNNDLSALPNLCQTTRATTASHSMTCLNSASDLMPLLQQIAPQYDTILLFSAGALHAHMSDIIA